MTVPGIGPVVATAIISEIVVNIGEFFTSEAHLASWAGPCAGNHESPGKRKHGQPRKGSQHLTELAQMMGTRTIRRNWCLTWGNGTKA